MLVVAAVVVVVGAGALVAATVTGGHGAQPRPGAAGRRTSLATGSGREGSPAAAGTASPEVLAAAGSDHLPSDCVPNPAGPPTAPYQLGMVGTVHGGTLTAGPATVGDITATFCGVVTVVNNTGSALCPVTGQLSSPPDGQVFGSLSVELTLVPGMTPTIGFKASPGTISGAFSCTEGSQNGLLVALEATVGGTTTSVFGVQCTIGPLTIPLSGVITGPFTDLTGTLTSSDFTVPAIAASTTCPGAIPTNIDAIAGLPLGPGQGSISLPVTASLYQPAGQP